MRRKGIQTDGPQWQMDFLLTGTPPPERSFPVFGFTDCGGWRALWEVVKNHPEVQAYRRQYGPAWADKQGGD